MSSVTDSISSLFTSIFNIFRSIIATFFHSIQAVFATAQNLIMSVVNMAGGLVQFLLSNIVIIGVLVAAYVGYTAYAQKKQPGSISKKRS